MADPDFLAIVGPTGSGKTGLSLRLAEGLDSEVVSMDSRQIYRGMDIGTGKVTLRERALVPHHGLDLRDPDETYSAGQFARDARGWIRDIRSRGRVPLLVGGTGFFLKTLTEPLFEEPAFDEDRMHALRSFLNDLEADRLKGFVEILNPEPEGELPVDRQRMTRSVEVALLTGRPLSWWHSEATPVAEPLRGFVVLLDPDRDSLYDKIHRRVGQMVADGVVDEVERLLKAGYPSDAPGMTGAGYRELIGYLQGSVTLEDATEEIRRSHRRYARRQTTWFRHQLPRDTLRIDGDLNDTGTLEMILERWALACEAAPPSEGGNGT
jgi:tRNA dimethylallyltransferase